MEKHKNNNNIKFQVSALTSNDEFELPDALYSASDIKDCFQYILKKLEENINDPSKRIYVNKIENRNTSEIKTG